ncbi:hypothetical protein [Halorhabdus amylolytica]|uniref:hypothetical protein n=1 Tax=Halorhabdus amylolytica TaxID=2559573 RepID=UPI0020BE1C1C|nr:hypothetical protein [Halorhabdus amylolytica]
MTASPIDTDDERRRVVEELHDHLAATAERPLDRTANRWIGEAQALAADLRTAPDDADLVRKRAADIASLLAEVDDIDDPTANDHVAAAADLADRLQAD